MKTTTLYFNCNARELIGGFGMSPLHQQIPCSLEKNNHFPIEVTFYDCDLKSSDEIEEGMELYSGDEVLGYTFNADMLKNRESFALNSMDDCE